MAEKRLGPDEWIRCGTRTLAAKGWTALRADTLAKTLGVSRGSFYWHFADVAAFRRAVLDRWRELALKNVIAEIDPLGPGRPAALVRRAFGTAPQLEVAVRAWATVDETARAVVRSVDAERVAYMRKMLIEEGVAPAVASARANIMNWTYLGFALSSGKAQPKLDDVFTELVAFALPVPL
jgi:AcrR family transcriptional regulator